MRRIPLLPGGANMCLICAFFVAAKSKKTQMKSALSLLEGTFVPVTNFGFQNRFKKTLHYQNPVVSFREVKGSSTS